MAEQQRAELVAVAVRSDQQDLRGRRLSILVLPTTSWPRVERHGAMVASAINGTGTGAYMELTHGD